MKMMMTTMLEMLIMMKMKMMVMTEDKRRQFGDRYKACKVCILTRTHPAFAQKGHDDDDDDDDRG